MDLAQQVGCTQAEISMVERGKTKPRIETLQKIASVLNVPEDELLTDYVAWSNTHLTSV
jgi:transcriptional regulator with XRE-family HTH domain